MISPSSIWLLVRRPRNTLEAWLSDPPSPRSLLLGTVTPLAAIGGIAVLARSLIVGSPLAGIVIGTGSFALRLGAWLGLALVIPAIARQFDAEIDDRRGFALATYVSIPLWLAGVVYVIPEDPWYVFLWSRALVFIIGAYGLFIMRVGVAALDLERRVRTPITAVTGLAAVTLYIGLSILIGVASTVVMLLVSASD